MLLFRYLMSTANILNNKNNISLAIIDGNFDPSAILNSK